MEKNVVASFVKEISEFKGESANMYKTRLDYVAYGGFERDYFASWYENYDCANGCLPALEDVMSFCQCVDAAIQEWLNAVEDGVIDPEDDWAE